MNSCNERAPLSGIVNQHSTMASVTTSPPVPRTTPPTPPSMQSATLSVPTTPPTPSTQSAPSIPMPTKPVQTSTQLLPMQEEQSALTVIPKFIEPETILGGHSYLYTHPSIENQQCNAINQSIMPESNRIRKRPTIRTLPDEVVAHASAYLSPPSQALFAISQCCTPQATQLTVTQAKWDTLNFGLLEKRTASKLTDDDLAKILNLTNAKDALKILKLTGCAGIVGSGLKPLMNSTTLEEIDLRLIHENNKFSELRVSKAMLDEATLVPILLSMLPPNLPGPAGTARSMCSSSLLLIRYPKHWRDKKSAILAEFLQSFDAALKGRKYRCCSENCDLPCGDAHDEIYLHQEGDFYGIANYLCTRCKKTFCDLECPVEYCEKCEHHSCMDCDPTFECDECNETTCMSCTMIGICETCGKTTCDECSPVLWCDHCETSNCLDCEPMIFCSKEGCYCHSCIECFKVWHCDRCDEDFCFDCAWPIECHCCDSFCCNNCSCD